MRTKTKTTKAILGAALAALLATPAVAQDWMSVAPKGKKVLLDNASVRVIEMTVGPGQKEPIHTHPANLAYLLTAGKVRVSYVGGDTAEMDGKKGEVIWSDPEGPHTLENLSKTPIRALVVELKEHPYVAAKR
ncbi:MAG: cupin domain-containing protein [Thermoanaerobaculia bacterium]|mgnify:FL=1